jgi:hypothetical protein
MSQQEEGFGADPVEATVASRKAEAGEGKEAGAPLAPHHLLQTKDDQVAAPLGEGEAAAANDVAAAAPPAMGEGEAAEPTPSAPPAMGEGEAAEPIPSASPQLPDPPPPMPPQQLHAPPAVRGREGQPGHQDTPAAPLARSPPSPNLDASTALPGVSAAAAAMAAIPQPIPPWWLQKRPHHLLRHR